MPPENYRYGGGASGSTIHPIVAIALLIALICMMVLPRKQASLPILGMTLLFPQGHQIYIAGVHLFALRMVVLAGIVRALGSKDWISRRSGLNNVDHAFVVCILAQAIAPILLFREFQTVVYEVGYVWDWLGAYFVFRWLIQDQEDIHQVLKFTALLLIPVAIGMLLEQLTLVNVFGLLGAGRILPEIREGKIRSQGVFSHSLMAGSFAAAITPLFLILWRGQKSRLLAILGFVLSTEMMLMSNSSTPLLAYAAGLGALFMWPVRRKLRYIRWALSVTIVGLHLVMKAPVWMLIGRIDLTGSSSSYHRAQLVDQFIQHFSDWWLIGTNDAVNWGLDMWDVQNQYVNVGETGGLLALWALVMVISRSFGRIGNLRKRVEGDKDQEWVLWFLGCALFANVVGFFGVNYFDQSRIGFIAHLAMVSAFTVTVPVGPGSPEASGRDGGKTLVGGGFWPNGHALERV